MCIDVFDKDREKKKKRERERETMMVYDKLPGCVCV